MMKNSRSPNPVCAAVGDGANDVSMILEAHVGIGLFGKEGRQAVRSADYALGKFRFLKRAFLFHGFHYYVRTANLVLYFFYKNLVFTMTQVLFGIYSVFSSQSIYSSLYLLLYNITMTSLPIVLYGIFEQRLPEYVLMNIPEVYKTISKNSLLSWKNFFTWLGFAAWHAVVIFFGTYFLACEGVSNGGDGGSPIGVLEGYGSFMINCVFLGVTIRLLLVTYHLNILIFGSILLTLVVNYSVFIMANFVLVPGEGGSTLLGIWTRLGSGSASVTTYLALLVLFALCFFPDIIYRMYQDRTMDMFLSKSSIDLYSNSTEESESNSNAQVNQAYYGSLVS